MTAGPVEDDDPVELYEHAPCGHFSARPDGTIVKVNGTLLAWTGYRREELLGRRFPELLPPGGRIYHETHVAPLLGMQGMVREIATELVCADGERLPVILNAVLERDGDGAPRIVRAALFDATERRAYEDELLRARRRAEELEHQARVLAETLQASFLPPDLLVIPDLDVAGAYRPAGDGTEVGGDFYDVFETGRDTWGIVLGDVCGKGASAATVTALARYTIRAAALRSASPSLVLRTLHEAMVRSHVERFLTALLLVIDRDGDGFRVTVAAGGHHLPLRRRDGAVDRIGEPGSFLGMLEDVHLVDVTEPLRSGDVLVLYTDGVTEARHQGGAFLDDEGLEALVGGAPDELSAQELADLVVDHALAFQEGVPRDDIAVVVLRVP